MEERLSRQFENLSVQEKQAGRPIRKPARPAPPPPRARNTKTPRQDTNISSGKANVPPRPVQPPQNAQPKELQKPDAATPATGHSADAGCPSPPGLRKPASDSRARKKPVPPKRTSSLRKADFELPLALQRPLSQGENSVSAANDGQKAITLPRAQPRRRDTTTVEDVVKTESAVRKKKSKPHVIDARPTRYEAIDFSASRHSWLEKVRSKHRKHASMNAETVNPFAPCVRQHSVPDAESCKDTTNKRQSLPPVRPPPPSSSTHHSQKTLLSMSLPTNSFCLSPSPATASKEHHRLLKPLPAPDTSPSQPVADREPKVFKRPRMPLPISSGSPPEVAGEDCNGPQMALPITNSFQPSPPLEPVAEFENGDGSNTGDSGNIEDHEDITAYSVIKLDSVTGRYINVFESQNEKKITQKPSPECSDSEADEYIYPVCQWNPQPEQGVHQLPRKREGAKSNGSAAVRRDSGVYMTLDSGTQLESGEYTSLRFGEASCSTSNTSSAQPLTNRATPTSTNPASRKNYENFPPSRPKKKKVQYENVEFKKNSHHSMYTPLTYGPSGTKPEVSAYQLVDRRSMM